MDLFFKNLPDSTRTLFPLPVPLQMILAIWLAWLRLDAAGLWATSGLGAAT